MRIEQERCNGFIAAPAGRGGAERRDVTRSGPRKVLAHGWGALRPVEATHAQANETSDLAAANTASGTIEAARVL